MYLVNHEYVPGQGDSDLGSDQDEPEEEKQDRSGRTTMQTGNASKASSRSKSKGKKDTGKPISTAQDTWYLVCDTKIEQVSWVIYKLYIFVFVQIEHLVLSCRQLNTQFIIDDDLNDKIQAKI